MVDFFFTTITRELNYKGLNFEIKRDSELLLKTEKELNYFYHRGYYLKIEKIITLNNWKEIFNTNNHKYLTPKKCYHGTKLNHLTKILKFGFQPSLSNKNNLLGKGVYFSSIPSKAFQYSIVDGISTGLLLRAEIYLGKSKKIDRLEEEIICNPNLDSIVLEKGTILPQGTKLIDNEICIYSPLNIELKSIYIIKLIDYYYYEKKLKKS